MRQVLWHNIQLLREVSRLPEADFARLLGFSEENYLSLKKQTKDVPLTAAVRLSEAFNVDLHGLWGSSIDRKAAERYFHRAPIELPERYNVGKFSKVRSVLNLLEGVRLQRGEQYLENLLRHSQIPQSFFDDPEKMINVRFLTDLTELLAQRGWSSQQLFALGQMSYQTHRQSSFGQSMATYRSWKKVYEGLVLHHSGAFDRNYDYKLHLSQEDRIIIDAVPREEVCEALKTDVFDTETTCFTRMGVMSTASCYASLPASIVTKLKSIHEGDGRNRYEIRPSATPLFS